MSIYNDRYILNLIVIDNKSFRLNTKKEHEQSKLQAMKNSIDYQYLTVCNSAIKI